MTNVTPNLGSVITSAVVRKTIYTAYVVSLVIVGALQVAYASTETAAPEWLTIALAVIGYLGIPVGGLALANTGTAPTATDGKHEAGAL